MNWKLPPPRLEMRHVSKSLELQILLGCNWACHACDQFSNLPTISWVRKATMSVSQIEAFAAEMRAADAFIGRVRILGGEPTLHPQLTEIAAILRQLRLDGHLAAVELITNGSKNPKLFKDQVDRIRISGQGDKERNHTANLAATPATLGYQGRVCNAPWHCGISLNYYGYFPCSSGAGLARLMNNVPHWQRMALPRPVYEEWPDLPDLCNHCYHGLRKEDKVKCGTDGYDKNVPAAEMWGHLAPWLHGKTPENWRSYAATTGRNS